jgi:hypothetical protein
VPGHHFRAESSLRAESSTPRRVIPSGAGSLTSDPVKSRDLLSLSCPEISARSGVVGGAGKQQVFRLRDRARKRARWLRSR